MHALLTALAQQATSPVQKRTKGVKEPDLFSSGERVQKGIAHWDKQNDNMLAPNCMLNVMIDLISYRCLP